MKIKILFILLIFNGLICQAQKNALWNVTIGYGHLEKFHAGIDCRKNNYSVGFNFSNSFGMTYFSSYYSGFSIGVNKYIGPKDKADLSKFYINARLIYYNKGDELVQIKALMFGNTVGRSFFLVHRMGINIDVGYAINLQYKLINHTESLIKVPFITPELRLQVFNLF